MQRNMNKRINWSSHRRVFSLGQQQPGKVAETNISNAEQIKFVRQCYVGTNLIREEVDSLLCEIDFANCRLMRAVRQRSFQRSRLQAQLSMITAIL
uniref:Uncharacterized protein n=1 Tax=Heterorhabditis bacteriophora TaxID=37862 RepID=A0A1I7XE71_HETBA